MIAPPYYPLGRRRSWSSTSRPQRTRCAPLPFYLYAFTARSGYPLTPDVVGPCRAHDQHRRPEGVRSPFDKVAPYLALGLRVYVGTEPLMPQALADGATARSRAWPARSRPRAPRA